MTAAPSSIKSAYDNRLKTKNAPRGRPAPILIEGRDGSISIRQAF